jgi:hypothetical protein
MRSGESAPSRLTLDQLPVIAFGAPGKLQGREACDNAGQLLADRCAGSGCGGGDHE